MKNQILTPHILWFVVLHGLQFRGVSLDSFIQGIPRGDDTKLLIFECHTNYHVICYWINSRYTSDYGRSEMHYDNCKYQLNNMPYDVEL